MDHQPIPVCEAKTGALPGAYGFEPVYCLQTRGLRSTFDANGHRHFFCAAQGHAANVRLQVSRSFPRAMAPGELMEVHGR